MPFVLVSKRIATYAPGNVSDALDRSGYPLSVWALFVENCPPWNSIEDMTAPFADYFNEILGEDAVMIGRELLYWDYWLREKGRRRSILFFLRILFARPKPCS